MEDTTGGILKLGIITMNPKCVPINGLYREEPELDNQVDRLEQPNPDLEFQKKLQ